MEYKLEVVTDGSVTFVLPPPVFSGTVVIFTKAKRKCECWVLGF